MQTGREPSPHVASVRAALPEFEHSFFDDAAILAFFASHPHPRFPEITQRFKSLYNGEHRADLFRYFYLYLKGGVYLDTDVHVVRRIPELATCDFISAKTYHTHISAVFNGLLCVTPGHPIIAEALEDAYTASSRELVQDYQCLIKFLYAAYGRHASNRTLLLSERRVAHASLIYHQGSLVLEHRFESIKHSMWEKRGILRLRQSAWEWCTSNIAACVLAACVLPLALLCCCAAIARRLPQWMRQSS